jgi:hypothetical protein
MHYPSGAPATGLWRPGYGPWRVSRGGRVALRASLPLYPEMEPVAVDEVAAGIRHFSVEMQDLKLRY